MENELPLGLSGATALTGNSLGTVAEASRHIRQLLGWLGDKQAQLQLALEAADLGIWHWNPSTGELMWSARCRALIGVAPDTPAAFETFMERVHPDDRDRLSAAVARALDTGESYDEVFRVLYEDGSVHWLQTSGRAQPAQAGQLPSRMSGVVGLRRDFSDRAALADATPSFVALSLLESVQAVSDSLPLALLITDEAGAVVHANAAWHQLCGSSFDPAVGLPWKMAVHPHDAERAMLDWRKALGAQRVVSEFRCQRSGGEVRWVSAHTQALRNAHGAVTGTISLWVDETHVREGQASNDRALSRSRDLARRLLQLRSLERSELALEIQEEVLQGLEHLQAALAQTRAQDVSPECLARDMHSLATVATEKIATVRRILFDLNPPGVRELGFKGALETLLAEQSTRTDIHFELDIAQCLPPGPESMLATLFEVAKELVGNAIQHADAKKVQIAVAVDADRVRLRVSDDGSGISQADVSRPGRYGLLAATERASAQGGTLRIVGAAGTGTIVEVTLPNPAAGIGDSNWDYVI